MLTENASEIEERDPELEDTVGNVFVADYQTDRVRGKLALKIHPHIPLKYHRKKLNSTHIFKHKGKCYVILLEVEGLGSYNMTGRAKMQGLRSIFGRWQFKGASVKLS